MTPAGVRHGKNRAQSGWLAATRAWRRGDRWANTATRGINRAA